MSDLVIFNFMEEGLYNLGKCKLCCDMNEPPTGEPTHETASIHFDFSGCWQPRYKVPSLLPSHLLKSHPPLEMSEYQSLD